MYDTGIADRLRAEGLDVVEVDGWQWRGTGELYPQGFVFHHTADGPNGSAPSLDGVIYGFANSAPGPLANVLQSREDNYADRFYVIAAGAANHAGTGGWNGISGNNSVYGLEIEHTGVEHFPEERALLAVRCAAALIRGITDESMCCQHYEWSNWGDGSKIDVAQDVDANHWRDLVRDALAGRLPEPERPDMDANEHAWLERLHETLINQPYFLQAHYNGTDWTQNLHEQLVNQPFFLDAHYATAADVADLEVKIDAILDQLGIVVPASRQEPERAEPVEGSSAPPESRD